MKSSAIHLQNVTWCLFVAALTLAQTRNVSEWVSPLYVYIDVAGMLTWN